MKYLLASYNKHFKFYRNGGRDCQKLSNNFQECLQRHLISPLVEIVLMFIGKC